jgi:glycine/D-amino acid oxidase-like deaminating enzyme
MRSASKSGWTADVLEYAYWWDTVDGRGVPGAADVRTVGSPGAPASGPGGPLQRRYDVAIVGAGYTGLSAARVMAHAGADVLVLERERIGWGASSRNGGQVLAGLKVEPAALVARYGEARARALFDASLDALARLEALIASEAIACGYRRSGHVQCASKRSHFAAFRAERDLLARVFHHRVELVAPGDQRREVGSDRYFGLMVDERSGALNPAQYAEGLAAAAARAGVTIVCGTAVTGVATVGRWCRVATTAGEVEAGDVLLATDSYTTGATPLLQRRFVPVGSYAIATEPLAPAIASALLPRGRMAFDSKHVLHYFRLTGDRRLLFGGRAEFTQPTDDTIRRAAGILRRDMLEVFPELAPVRIDYAWGGSVAFTRDQMPRAGRLGRYYYAGGYAGHGVAMATHLGELVGRRMAGEPIEHPLFDDALPPIPLYRGKPWFLPVVGAYYRVKDWLE